MADICRIYRITERTARRWARQDGWRREGRNWALADAQESFERRSRTARIEAHLERTWGWLLTATGTGSA